MGDLEPLVPLIGGGGVFGILGGVIAYLLTANRADRRQSQEAIRDAEARADAAEARELAVREAAEAREKALQKRLDEEREARRDAQDRHAEVLREGRRRRQAAGGGV